MSVTDNTECFTSNFPTSLGYFLPDTLVHLVGSVDELSREGNDFGNDEFGDGSRVGKGRVEDRDTFFSGVRQVDLVRSDAKASNNHELGVSIKQADSDPGSDIPWGRRQ
jgi:hypothetical protein